MYKLCLAVVCIGVVNMCLVEVRDHDAVAVVQIALASVVIFVLCEGRQVLLATSKQGS